MAFRTNKTPVLQTKSASGSVASFNTALAMPLVNGEFTIQAYQEGSGDPSPDNVRNIVGYSALNMLHYGGNLFDKSTAVLGKWLDLNTGVEQNTSTNYTLSDYIPVKKGVYYVLKNPNSSRAWLYDQNYNPIERMNSTSLYTPSMDGYIRFTILVNNDMSTLNGFMVVVGNSLPTAYEPYVTPEVKTVALGEDVYGGSYNSVSGDKSKTWNKKTVSELSFTAQSGNRFTATISDCVNTPNFTGFLCSTYKPILVNANNNIWLSNRVVTIVDNRYTTAAEFKETMGDTQIVYPLAEPIESNIGETLIETYDGSNNIFCDTGDTSLVYKDLDIAKRGNFREVFRLPS